MVWASGSAWLAECKSGKVAPMQKGESAVKKEGNKKRSKEIFVTEDRK
jgi:hypothetical protein